MEFEETDKELDDEHVSPDDLLNESDIDDIIDLETSEEEDDDDALPELDAIKKDRARKHSLTIRRKIEKILEEKRIKKELDYLFEENASGFGSKKRQQQ